MNSKGCWVGIMVYIIEDDSFCTSTTGVRECECYRLVTLAEAVDWTVSSNYKVNLNERSLVIASGGSN